MPGGPRQKDMWGWTSLDHAVFEGEGEIVAFLLDKRDATPSMVFYDAIADGRFVLREGCSSSGLTRSSSDLRIARSQGEGILDRPRDGGRVPGRRCRPGIYRRYRVLRELAPHHAAQSGEADAVRLLLSRGADPYVENEQGECPRDLAVVAGYTRVAEILGQAGATRPEKAAVPEEPAEVELHGVAITKTLPGLHADALDAPEARLQSASPANTAFPRSLQWRDPASGRFPPARRGW